MRPLLFAGGMVASKGFGCDAPVVAYFIEAGEEGGVLFGECSPGPGGEDEDYQGWCGFWKRRWCCVLFFLCVLVFVLFVVEELVPPIEFVNGADLDGCFGGKEMGEGFKEG